MRVVGINLLVLALGVLLLELAFGSWVRDNRIRNLNLIVDELYVHDVEALYENGGRGVVYRRDAHGLRGEYGDPSQIDILSVGGSTTDQKYIGEGETWQDVLRERFAADGTTLRIANAGVDGHSTIGHLRAFEWWFPQIPGLAPRYVLFMVGLNDIHLPSKREYDRIEAAVEPSWRERSALFGAWRTLRGIWRASQRQVGHRRVDFAQLEWVEQPLLSDHAQRTAARRRQYGNRLRAHRRRHARTRCGAHLRHAAAALVARGRRRRARRGRRGNQRRRRLHHLVAVRDTTLEVCRAVRAVCVDLAGELRGAFEAGDFYDFAHFTPAGAAKIGDYLYRTLRDELEL